MFNNLFRNIPLRYGYYAILVGIIALFLLGFLPNSTSFVLIKIIFSTALVSFAYLQYVNHVLSRELGEEDESFPEIEEEDQEWLNIESDQDVEELFEQFLKNTLLLIKKIMVTDTVILLFCNYSKKIFNIRHIASDKEEALVTLQSFDIVKGLPSLIIRNRTPLIENHLPDGNEILPYYRSGESPAKSFAGVPLYFDDLIIGVLCMDTAVEEAYSNNDLDILNQFSKLIGNQIVNSNKLYEYETENWVVNTLFEVSRDMNRIQTVDELWNYLVSKLPGIIQTDRISISRKLNGDTARIERLEGGTGNLKTGREFPLTEGINGWVMRKNESLLVEDFSSKENYVPRFHKEETPAKDYFSLLAVPVCNNKELIGTICLESYQPKNFKEQHKRILQTIANQAAILFKTAQAVEALKTNSFIDPETNLQNKNAFSAFLDKELKRAGKQGYEFFLVFLKPSFELKEIDPDLRIKTIVEFLSLVLPELPPTYYIFKLGSDTFVIAAFAVSSSELEQSVGNLFERIASRKIWSDGRASNFYINAGILTPAFITKNVEEVIERGKMSIHAARQKGQNQMAVFDENILEISSHNK